MTHNHLVPGSSPGGTTLKPSKSLTMRVFVFQDFKCEPICEPKYLFLKEDEQKKYLYYIVFGVTFLTFGLVQDYIRPNYEGGNDLIIYFLGVFPTSFQVLVFQVCFM